MILCLILIAIWFVILLYVRIIRRTISFLLTTAGRKLFLSPLESQLSFTFLIDFSLLRLRLILPIVVQEFINVFIFKKQDSHGMLTRQQCFFFKSTRTLKTLGVDFKRLLLFVLLKNVFVVPYRANQQKSRFANNATNFEIQSLAWVQSAAL